MATLAVSPKTGAKMVGLSLSSFRRQVRAGKIRAVKVGRRILVPVNSLEKLLHMDEHPGPAELSEGEAKGEN